MASDLHAFTNDVDIIIAADLEDAWKVWQEQTGGSDDSYRDELRQLPADHEIGIWCDADGRIAEIGQGAIVTRTAADWVEREGRGFLASTEF